MPYIGNPITSGENNSFKVLDDITSYTLTFNGSSASIVSVANNTITYNSHRFITGQRVTYNTTGTAITGLTAATVYFIIKEDQNTIKLATTYANAINNTAIDLTGLGTGTTHTINVAFDGINTKFTATYDNGTKAQITRAAQLTLSVNGVIQQPQDTISPTNGFGIDLDSVIIFSVAPLVTDIFWGNLVANNFPTFDISDNTVDSFTGTGSLTTFTLSKEPANSQNLLVTIDGVVQYPNDANVTRAYSVVSNVLTFEGAPGNGTDIQVRHIGFAGATSSNVTGFYGRTGNVGLTTADNVNVGNVNAQSLVVSGITTVSAGSTADPSISPTGDSNTGIFFPSADTIAFSEGGAEAMRIKSDGSVGIGTINPSAKLDVEDNSASGYIAEFRQKHTSNSAQILIDSPSNGESRPVSLDMSRAGVLQWSIGQAYLDTNQSFHISTSTLQSGNTGSKLSITQSGNLGINTTSPERKLDVVDSGANGSVIRSKVTTNNGGYLAYEALNSSGTSVFNVTHNGRINLSENIVFASGQGLDFSATANSSGTMTSELLDDYEEGSFTPSMVFDGSDLGVVYSVRTGRYTKIGNRVFFNIVLNISNKGTATGIAAIAGLPFTSGAGDQGYGAAVGADIAGITFDNIITYRIVGGNTSITLLENGGGGITEADFTNTSQQIVSGHYYVD